ncbi:MAG: Calx-beta domain-containing protein [Phormidium sp.]
MDLISFTRETFEVAELGQSKFPVTLVRTGLGIGAVTAQIKLASSTKSGRATLGKDYKHSTVTVTWDDGEIGEKIVDVGIIDDGITEPLERVNLSFNTITGAIVGAIATCIAIIQDSTKVTASPDKSQIVDLMQSDYAQRQVSNGFCFNEKFIKPGINLSITGKDRGILIWHYRRFQYSQFR